MACGVCGDPGHNRRTHSAHEPVQGEALIDQPSAGEPVAPTGADRAREALRARWEAPSMGSVPSGTLLHSGTGEPVAAEDEGGWAAYVAKAWDAAHAEDAHRSTGIGDTFRMVEDVHLPGDAPLSPDLVEYFAEVDEVIDAITPEETEQKLAEVIAAPAGEWIRVDNLGVGDTVTATPEGTLEVRTSSVVPDEEGRTDNPIVNGEPVAYSDGGVNLSLSDEQFLDAFANQPDHECEPAPDQVYFCRHCGESLDPVDAPTPPWRTVRGPHEPILITLPGVFDLTAEQYHDVNVTGDWLSNSDVKKILQTCPAQFQYDRENGVRKTSDAFDFGHVWHARVLGKGEAYRVFEPKKLDGRTKEGKEQRAEVEAARAAGITPIYGDQFALIEAMAQAIEADPVPHALLTAPGRQEVCLFWYETIKVTNPHNKLYGQMVQVKRRAMIDHLPDMPEEDGATVTIVDGKTAEDVKPDDDMRKKIYDYAYHRQAETYAAAVEALFNKVADVVFIFQSKKPPHLVVPVELDTPALRVAAAENRQAMEIWAECVATGEWPGYVTNGIATSGVPAWIERQFEEEMS